MKAAIVERTVARRGVAGILTAAEYAKLEAFPAERRRRDWLAGRLVAKRAVRAVCHELDTHVPSYTTIDVWNDDSGAPHFSVDHDPELSRRFSLSIAHTDGTAIAAVADRVTEGDVGVDIEVSTPLSPALVARVLRPSERARLESMTEERPSPLAMWTAKEAALKAAHRFCDALVDVELAWTHPRRIRARVVGDHAPRHSILVRHRAVGPYTIAVALCR